MPRVHTTRCEAHSGHLRPTSVGVGPGPPENRQPSLRRPLWQNACAAGEAHGSRDAMAVCDASLLLLLAAALVAALSGAAALDETLPSGLSVGFGELEVCTPDGGGDRDGRSDVGGMCAAAAAPAAVARGGQRLRGGRPLGEEVCSSIRQRTSEAS
eukprot:347241-Chlamydomonas_euryale.AAC.13